MTLWQHCRHHNCTPMPFPLQLRDRNSMLSVPGRSFRKVAHLEACSVLHAACTSWGGIVAGRCCAC